MFLLREHKYNALDGLHLAKDILNLLDRLSIQSDVSDDEYWALPLAFKPVHPMGSQLPLDVIFMFEVIH